MRNDDPDEADQPAHSDRRSRACGRRRADDQAYATDVDPEARRFVVAERQDVEHTAVQYEHNRADSDVRRRDGSVVP